MHTADLFRWLYTATGLWLILSPFMIFSQAALSQNAVTKEAGVLMAFGLTALIISWFSYRKHRVLQAGLGVFLGMALLMSPSVFGFTDNAVAIWNVGTVGLGVLLITLIALLKPRSESRSW